jgi:hypothetical protein
VVEAVPLTVEIVEVEGTAAWFLSIEVLFFIFSECFGIVGFEAWSVAVLVALGIGVFFALSVFFVFLPVLVFVLILVEEFAFFFRQGVLLFLVPRMMHDQLLYVVVSLSRLAAGIKPT